VFVYDHCDVEHLAWGIDQADGRGALIVTDSVFALDGDVAPLDDIVELAQRAGIRTVIDEAHAIGTLGPGGRGALAEAGLEDQVDVIVGTLGKALGVYGAFVACDRAMSRYLLNAASTLHFSTALPPPIVAGALAALDLLQEKPRRVQKLAANAAALRAGLIREGFDVGGSRTQILPVLVGETGLTMRICEAALLRGVFTQAIVPPAVPPLTARLRLAVMATHQEEELLHAARTLGAVAKTLGFEPRSGAVGHRAGPVPVSAAGEPDDIDDRWRETPGIVAASMRGVFDFEAPEPVRRAA
jgi:7-keto-8-aminopelargonate synthetase-like enzyme